MAPHYGEVQAVGVYPSIDVLYHGDPHRFEYDFIVRPSADPALTHMRLSSSDSADLLESGALQVGGLRFEKPFAYQHFGGARRPVVASYKRFTHGSIGFELAEYDSTRVLIIDPVAEYAT